MERAGTVHCGFGAISRRGATEKVRCLLWNYLSGMRAWSQSPMREAEGLSRLHNTITDWPDSGYGIIWRTALTRSLSFGQPAAISDSFRFRSGVFPQTAGINDNGDVVCRG